MTPAEQRIAEAIGAPVAAMQPLAGGCVADVYRVDFEDGRRPPLVAKLSARGGLAIEGWMLTYLGQNSRLPVPDVIHCHEQLLLMAYLENSGVIDSGAERDAADHLAALHAVTAPQFGLARDTVIGPLSQPNPWSDDWIGFFRDQRLLAMGRGALDSGQLPAAVFSQLDAFCGKLADFLEPAPVASLLHGDLWAGNILAARGRIAGFIDPAIYYGDAEIELAFATLFNSLGETFFARYGERRPIRPGFFEARKDIYNLYPLLVHATLFGGSYADAVQRTLQRYG